MTTKSDHQTTERPRVEVVLNVDASGQEDVVDAIVVFIDGTRYEPDLLGIVDHGSAGETRVNLRHEAWNATRDGSQAYRNQLDRWYGDAEEQAEDDFLTEAVQVQPGIKFAAELNPSLWFDQSAALTPTRRAAQAAVAARVFHTCAWQSYPPRALEIALAAYRSAVRHPKGDGFDVLIADLLTDLRHLAEAYSIRLESEPDGGPTDALARDLRELLAEIRTAARGPWAEQLAATGKTLADVEYQAFNAFLNDCTDPDGLED